MEANLVPQNIDCSFIGKVFSRHIIHLEDLITREKFTMSRAPCWREKKYLVLMPGGPRPSVIATQLNGSLIQSPGHQLIPTPTQTWAHLDLSFPVYKSWITYLPSITFKGC